MFILTLIQYFRRWRCFRNHKPLHRVKQLEYGSFYYCECPKCDEVWAMKRN